jgi:prepilin-type N-terminal cleavage/methylation domain-containing protein
MNKLLMRLLVKGNDEGFTLIELLVVIIILGVLFTIGLGGAFRVDHEKALASARQELENSIDYNREKPSSVQCMDYDSDPADGYVTCTLQYVKISTGTPVKEAVECGYRPWVNGCKPKQPHFPY